MIGNAATGLASEIISEQEGTVASSSDANSSSDATSSGASDNVRYAIIEIYDNGKITVLDSSEKVVSGKPRELLEQKMSSVFAIKITKKDCTESDGIKCIEYGGAKYELDLETAVTKEEAKTKLIDEKFLASVSVDTGTDTTGSKSVTGPESVMGHASDDGCADNVQDISGNFYKSTRNIEKISDFYTYIPFYLFLNDILRNNQKCSTGTITTIHTIMDEIYTMPITFDGVLNDIEVKKITDINGLYGLMQFINTTSDYGNLTADVISKKLGELINAGSNTVSTILEFKLIAPSNASNSCWLNSALMAYLVPLYVACNNDITKLKENVIFVDGQMYIVDLIHKYIDEHFDKTDRNGYNGSEIIKKIKEYLVRPTVLGELNEYLKMTTPDTPNNQHTFLSSDIFHFDTVLNGNQAFTKPDVQERTNVVPLKLNAKTVKIKNLTLTIDSEKYEIGQDIRFITFTFNNDAPREFGEAVKNFLTDKITVGNKVYERVSFIMASRGHYVVVTKNKDKYYMIDDLPPTITEINNVSGLITNRSKLLNGYYYTVGIVYILKDGACPENGTNVLNTVKLGEETESINAENIANKETFKDGILEAIKIYDNTNISENKNPERNIEQLNKLKNMLQRLYPEEYKQPGGSRKTLGPKLKKTKRKYYVYKK
jgi:hypothetical protein